MRDETRDFYRNAMQRAALSIASSLDEAIDLGALAKAAALSPFHFHRVFRGMVGETPLELHRRLRLERAAWQLTESQTGVTRVALDAGYETHEAFTRAFRARYGVSPSEFRAGGARSASGARLPRLAARSGLHWDPAGAASSLAFETVHQGAEAMKVEIRHREALRLAAVTHLGPYTRIGEAFARLGELVQRDGLAPHALAMIAIYHDDPESTPPGELRSEACLAVPEGIALGDGLHEVRIPAGRYASTIHVGAFDGLPDAWSRLLGRWLPASGERLGDGPSHEVYLSDMRTTPMERQETELVVSIA